MVASNTEYSVMANDDWFTVVVGSANKVQESLKTLSFTDCPEENTFP